jgi:hypothetical protein
MLVLGIDDFLVNFPACLVEDLDYEAPLVKVSVPQGRR